MKRSELKYIYGPVYSWRLGMSLGIDPVSSQKKICNFDCIYCQLGRTAKFYTERENFVSVEDIIKEINSLPPMEIDYYTFSGRGEPTLAKNLGAMIEAVRAATGGKVAVITNAALISDEDVQKDLMRADLILVKLDACDEDSLKAIDVPADGIHFEGIVDGIKAFRQKFAGKLALQIMFIEENKKCAQAMAQIAKAIGPDEVQVNTPLRPSGTIPLCEEDLLAIKKYFEGLPVTTVYEAERRDVKPIDEKATIRRHGNFKKKAKFG
ncbi:MAG: radical SAM protein [Candidatus Omnitrophica bacterium]|nr:radical SAM protein [Candidatus Omnitrophota bacterium]